MNRDILTRFGPWINNRARGLLEPFEDGFQLSDLPGVISKIIAMVAELRTDDENQRNRLVFIIICFVADHTTTWFDATVDAAVKMIAAGFLGLPLDSAPDPDDWELLEPELGAWDVSSEAPADGVEKTAIEVPADGVERTHELRGVEAGETEVGN